MKTRIALALALLVAVPAAAAQTPLAADALAQKEELVQVALDTAAGRIVLELDKARAPVTTANFLRYVEGGKFNGESFYRAMPLTGGGLIQGGITSDARKIAKPIAHEPPSQTGLSHVAGTISMAGNGPGTAQSDFFILMNDIPSFDSSFAPFGRVVEGMDVVKAIFAAPRSTTRGEGVMKGQMLEPPVRITKAERLK